MAKKKGNVDHIANAWLQDLAAKFPNVGIPDSEVREGERLFMMWAIPASVSLEDRAQLLELCAQAYGGAPKEVTLRSPLELAVWWAMRGDWGCLADYIEASRMGNKEMRTFIAGVLRQEIKKPPNRGAGARRIFGRGGVIERVRFFLSLRPDETGREAAIDRTAEKFGIDRRTIQRDIKEGEAIARFLDAHIELMSRASHGAPRCYAVSDAALTPHFVS